MSEAPPDDQMPAPAQTTTQADAGPQPAALPPRVLVKDDPSQWNDLERRVVDAVKTVFDPEIPVDIWELGLIYTIRTGDEGHVHVDMTLTSPMCPAAGSMPPELQRKVSAIEGVMTCGLEIIWDPPWTPAMMSEVARLELNIPT